MTSEPRTRPVTPVGMQLQDWRRGAPVHRRTLAAVGLGVIVSLALVGFSLVASAFLVRSASTALFSSGQGQIRNGSPVIITSQQSLKLQSLFVEQRRAAVAAYGAQVAAFKIAMSRQPDALGLDAAEIRRRDNVLTGLTLDCINAVNQYNLGAQAEAVAQLRSSDLPERFAWAVDCASSP
ncbi:MAG: hypothetical protein ACYDEB_10725 [Dehalococcoidia bacterium]